MRVSPPAYRPPTSQEDDLTLGAAERGEIGAGEYGQAGGEHDGEDDHRPDPAPNRCPARLDSQAERHLLAGRLGQRLEQVPQALGPGGERQEERADHAVGTRVGRPTRRTAAVRHEGAIPARS